MLTSRKSCCSCNTWFVKYYVYVVKEQVSSWERWYVLLLCYPSTLEAEAGGHKFVLYWNYIARPCFTQASVDLSPPPRIVLESDVIFTNSFSKLSIFSIFSSL